MDKNLKISISGASGLLGTYLALHFINLGCSVRCHRNKSSIPEELKKFNLTWVEGDIRDQYVVKQLLDSCDIFIHTAAIVSFDKSSIEKMLSINVEGTKRVVDYIIGTDIKLIHISSISALGRVDNGKKVTENTVFNSELKNSAYAQSKYLAELEVHRGIAEGIDAMILLPSIILGKNFHNSSSSTLWDQIIKMPKFAPSGANGFVDIRDVVSATEACINKWNSGKKYIVNGHNLEYVDLYNKVINHKKINQKAKKISPTILLMLLPFVKLFYLLSRTKTKVSKQAILTTSKSYVYSNQKSISDLELNYLPIENTVEYFS